MKKYFTSDWHLGEDRIGINGKPKRFDIWIGCGENIAQNNQYLLILKNC